MDIELLKTELAKAAYAGLSDQAAADALNAATIERPRERFINERTIFSVLGGADGEAFMQGIEAASLQNPVIKRALKWLEPNQAGVDIGLPLTRDMLDSLVAAGALNAESVAAVQALGVEMVSRAQEMGLGVVEVDDIAYVRQIMGVTANG
jgi:hypothetical protein